MNTPHSIWALRRHLLAAIVLVGFLPLLIQDEPFAAGPAQPSLLRPYVLIEPFDPQGAFVVEAWRGEHWESLGRIEADKHFRVQTLNLPAALGEAPVRLRLTAQGGGGGAHLDSVRLAGMAPRAVVGAPRHKLLARDHDVADAREQAIELEFPRVASHDGAQNLTLQVTGRIEPEVISSIPFQFPLANMRQPITPQSAFYTYALGSQPGRLTVDGDLESEALGAPFFNEFYPSGSGHVQAPTLGWVSNDDTHLYVAIEFPGDNTVDGLKDYTAVYANTPTGVRRFQASEGEQHWGRPGFQSTARAPWEHKVYEFAIPLAELGLGALHGAAATLQLAFAAYGTNSPGDWEPALVFNSACTSFALMHTVVQPGDYQTSQVEMRALNTSGSAVGTDHIVSTTTSASVDRVEKRLPAVAHDTANNRYLVVWEHFDIDTGSGSDVFGQLVDGDGTLIGGSFAISNNLFAQYTPRVAFDSVNERYLVTWIDWRNGNPDVYGQLVSADGALLVAGTLAVTTDATVNIPIVQLAGFQPASDVAFDPGTQSHLVAYSDSADGDLYGIRVAADGTVIGSAFLISDATGTQSEPSIARDSTNSRFLVVWYDNRNADTDLFGALVNGDGTLFDRNGDTFVTPGNDEITILDEADSGTNQYNPRVAYDPIAGRFLVAYSENATADIRGAYYTSPDDAALAPFDISVGGDFDYSPTVAANSSGGGFLVAWQNQTSTPYTLGVATATLAPPGGSRGAGGGLPPWTGPLLATLVALWVAAWAGARLRTRLRPVFRAVMVGVMVGMLATGVVASCSSSSDSTPPPVSCPS